jgi:hypothetical protein
MKTFSMLTLLLLLPVQPSLVCNGAGLDAHRLQFKSSETEDIPTVAFCELVKNPRRYFDKTVRITATYQMATEAQYLSDAGCVLSHDEQIGVGHSEIDEKQGEIRRSDERKISTNEYGGRAKVTITGILRNKSRRDFAWYHYRFDIISFENISHIVVPYEGTLQAGITYQAAVRGDGRKGLSLVIPLRMPEHYAVLIEWTNLNEFPALKQPGDGSGEKRIVFSVISDQIMQMTVNRWNRTVQCKIISVE